jgi:hypothetical protein
MSLVGFAVAGQFVSLGGLEIPYYMTMIGVVLLKQQAATLPVAIAQPSSTSRHSPGVRLRPAHVRRFGL